MSKRVKISFFFQFNAKEIKSDQFIKRPPASSKSSDFKFIKNNLLDRELVGHSGKVRLCSNSTLLLGIEMINPFTESIFLIFHELWDISSLGFSSCVDQGSIHNSTWAKNSSLPYKYPPARVLISRLDFPNLDAPQPVRNRRSYAIELTSTLQRILQFLYWFSKL